MIIINTSQSRMAGVSWRKIKPRRERKIGEVFARIVTLAAVVNLRAV